MEKEKLTRKKLRAKKEGKELQLAEATNDLGDLYSVSENWVKALEEYKESFEAYERLGEGFKCVLAHRKIGAMNANLGNYECAIEHINLHIEGAREFGNDLEKQRGFATLGRTYFLLAHTFPEKSNKRMEPLANAKKAYSESMKLCLSNERLEGIEREELLTMRARLLLNQGLVQVAQNEHTTGILLIESAISIFAAIKGTDELHRAHITLAAIHEKEKNYEEALKILDHAAKIENISKKADALLVKAKLFLKIGEWVKARKVLVALYTMKSLRQAMRKELEKSLRIAVTLCRIEKKLNNSRNAEPDYLKLYEDFGDAAAAARCYDKALEYYKQMLFYAESNGSKEKVTAALISLAQTCKDAGRFEEALPYARRELKMCSDNPREACKTALALADLLESSGSMSSEIIDMYKLALSHAEMSGEPSLEITVVEEYLHYLEMQKSEMKERLKFLMETTPGLESEREIISSQEIGADIQLDELSDLESMEEETNKRKFSKPTPKYNGRSDYVIKRSPKRNGNTELHTACIGRNIERVKQLLKDGHPTNVRDNCGWTPLHEAAIKGSSEIVKLLITAGADINDRGGDGCEGVTPLHDAAVGGNFGVMNLLIEKGADTHAVTENGDSILDLLEGWRKRAKTWDDAAESVYRSFCSKFTRKGVPKRKSFHEDKQSNRVAKRHRNSANHADKNVSED